MQTSSRVTAAPFSEELIAHILEAFMEVNNMAQKEVLDKLSIYVPQKKMEERPVERLMKLSEKKDRSVNYLVVEAILDFLGREEKKG